MLRVLALNSEVPDINRNSTQQVPLDQREAGPASQGEALVEFLLISGPSLFRASTLSTQVRTNNDSIH